MKLGVWAPFPHVLLPEPMVEEAVQELKTAGTGKEGDKAFQLIVDVIKKADESGFDITLIPERLMGPDHESWMVAAALARETKNIRLMTAVIPGIMSPQLAAKLGASLDRITGGRFAVNVVNGWFKEEFDVYSNGAWLDNPEDRYGRMEEFVTVLRGMWEDENFTYQGKFYQVNYTGSLPIRPTQKPAPQIFAASTSEQGKETIAKHCDVWFLAYKPGYASYEENVGLLRDEIAAMKERAAKYNRSLEYAISCHVIVAPTQEEAEAQVADLEKYGETSQLASVASRSLGSGLVGSPETIAQRIKRYEEIGINLLMLRFYPEWDGLNMFCEKVVPLLK